MNEKFAYMSTTGKTDFFAYIHDNNPQLTTTTGALTIVDNSNNDISGLASPYNLYIDDLFIAGGHGFPDYNSYISYLNKIINNENAIINIQNSILDNLNNTIRFRYSYTNNTNKFGIDKNYYGMITSYTILKLNENNNEYELESKRVNLNYITNINVNPINNIENKNNSFGINLLLDFVNNNENISEEYTLQLNSSQNSNTINPITLREYTKYFNRPANKLSDDLTLNIIQNNNIVYTYFYKDILKWSDTFKSSNYLSVTPTINVNFRTDNFNINNIITPFITAYNSFATNTFTNDQEIEVTFDNSNEVLYDYIIFTDNYNVEFYFNGIQSNNWNKQTFNNGTTTYYVYQSPQKYKGSHVWKIKINTIS